MFQVQPDRQGLMHCLRKETHTQALVHTPESVLQAPASDLVGSPCLNEEPTDWAAVHY